MIKITNESLAKFFIKPALGFIEVFVLSFSTSRVLKRKYLPALLWSVVILILCLMPKSDLPETPLFNIPYFDKWVHVVLFFVLSLTLLFAIPSRFWIVILIGIGYGAFIEILQLIIPTGRTAEWIDLFADGFGATFAAVFTLLLNRNNKQKILSDR